MAPQIPQRLFQVENNQRNAAQERVRLGQEHATHSKLISEADGVIRKMMADQQGLADAVTRLQVQLAQMEAYLSRGQPAPAAAPMPAPRPEPAAAAPEAQ